jgi:hypothetical protein
MATVWVMGLAAAWCAAQEPAVTYPVRGVIENSVTHQPIARALVDVGGSPAAVLTDGEGHFELNLPEGRFVITVRRPGYGQGIETRHEVKVDADTPALTFYLTQEASITGHATLSGGDEADGLHFFIYRKRNVEGHERWMQSGMAETDSAGDFRFLELEAPVSYVLCNDSSPDDTRAVTYGYPSMCFPGGTDFASATSAPLTVLPGQQAEVDIALTQQRFYRATVTMANLSQGQGASIEIYSKGGPLAASSMQRSRQPGMVEADLPNGNYYAEARFWGKPSTYGRVDFRISDGPLSGVTVNPMPLQPLMVEVHKDFTASNNGSNGSASILEGSRNDDNPGVNLNLIPADNLFGNPFGGNLRRPEGSGDSDLYEMNNVTPGRYWVRADSYQAYVSSITSGGTDLTREPLTIGPGGSGAPIEIMLRNDTGEIDCTVDTAANGAPTANSEGGEVHEGFAYAIPQSAYPGMIPRAFGTPDGTFKFRNLAPGTYTVVAFDRDVEMDIKDAEQLSRIAAQGKTVTVEAGVTAQVEVNLIPGGAESASQ